MRGWVSFGGERDRCEVCGVSEVGAGDKGVENDGGGLVCGLCDTREAPTRATRGKR